MDAVVLGVAVAGSLAAVAVSLQWPEMSRAVDRALVAALALCMAGGSAVSWGREHWWVLAALQGVMLLVNYRR